MDKLDILFTEVETYLLCILLNKFQGFESEELMIDKQKTSFFVWASIVFENSSKVPYDDMVSSFGHLTVRIRMPSSRVYSTINEQVNHRRYYKYNKY